MSTEDMFDDAYYNLLDLWQEGKINSKSWCPESDSIESKLIDLCKTIALECWGDAGQCLDVKDNG
jgi:hypothetical protein